MASNGIPITALLNIGGNLNAESTFVVVDLPANTSNKVTLGELTSYLFSSDLSANLGNIAVNKLEFTNGTIVQDVTNPALFKISTQPGVGIQLDSGNTSVWSFDIYGNLTFPDATVQRSAWSGNVSISEITGIGNAAAINLDGNISNVMTGDGSFVPLPIINGNIANSNLDGNSANVLLGTGSFGAVPGLGNVGGLNLDGNASNVLLGSGVFGQAPSVVLTGDGGNISNINGANVTGQVGYAAISNSVAAANVSGLGNIATIDLDGNVSNVLSGNGSFVALPVIPSLGNIAVINLDGNGSNVLLGNGVFEAVPGLGNVGSLNLDGSSGNVLHGNGVFAPVAGAFGSNISNGTSNIDIATSGGNVTTSVAGNANVLVVSGFGVAVTGNLSAGNIVAGAGSGGNISGANVISANTVVASSSFNLPVYASNISRDTAIASPTAGMMVFVIGSGMQVYGATQWNAVSGTAT